ncbi:MAG TPA: ribonuclease H-like domain-containing protein [Verrucomicrobiae bacterium]|nr:ribonuclease H-like domain-containing protein [Verrucomicrobiae bacterium]
MARDIIVYDIETKDTFQQIGTRDPRRLHISLIGMYSYRDDEYLSFTEDELPQFFRRLEDCDLIIGFNNKGFDDLVVSAMFPEITKVPSFDILEQVHKSLGFRIKLDNIAGATLGYGKSGDGLKAVRLYAEGKIEELREYCMDDVKITREVYDFAKRNGFLKYADLAGVKEFLVDFSSADRLVNESNGPMNLSLF